MNLIQRHLYLLAAVLAAFLLSVAAPLVAADPNCSAACVKRVEAREFAAKHGGCQSMVCVGRVEEKRWRHLRWQLPRDVKAMLERLRGCETRGLSFPRNYRYEGAHDGAYQYDRATWAQAGGHGRASDASAAEQDVRTARFFPSHRGQWACHA